LVRQSLLHETLESRFLMSASQSDSERSGQPTEAHLQALSCGYSSCSVPAPPAEYRAASAYQTAAVAFPLADTFKLHSLAAATKRIYLDFDGYLTTNTLWQTYWHYSDINTPAFSLDADYTTFSDAEKTTIQEIWARVTEDFAPFEVDVTTEDPGMAALVNSGAGDTAWGVRVVVGGDGKWQGSAAGIAVKGGFGDPKGSPAFAFADQWWKTNPNIVTQCISHEVGHTLGLDHDGPGYYQGHGTGPTSWVPIMGSGDKGLSQWSKGEYKNASNTEDDLAIITTKNGFGYRADDHGNTVASATGIVSTTTTMTAKGIIEQNTDADVFAFTTAGTINATVSPAVYGANLDILAEILNTSGAVVASSNPIGALNASFNITVSAGSYYLRVQGTGEGDPLGTGYTKYGSLGQYTVSIGGGTSPPSSVPTLSVSDLTLTEGNSGNTSGYVTISLSKASTQTVSVQWAPRDGTATKADNDYSFPLTGGMVSFAPGITSRQIDVVVTGDTQVEADETFAIALSSPQNATLAKDTGTITITNDDSAPPPVLPTLSVSDLTLTEGNSGNTSGYVTISLSKASTQTVSVQWAPRDGTAAKADNDYSFPLTGGTVSFAPGITSRQIDVVVTGDTQVEADETFAIALSSPQNATLAKDTGTITITNDDSAPPPPVAVKIGFSPTAYQVAEGAAGTKTSVPLTISLSAARSSAITVGYATSNGTAASGSDYLSQSGTLMIPAGQTQAKINVIVTGDATGESDETFTVRLASATGGVLLDAALATVTIVNDDGSPPLPAIQVGAAPVIEGNSGSPRLTFTITMATVASTATTLSYTTVDGTAKASRDYTATIGTITIPAGRTIVTVSVPVIANRVVDGNRTLSLQVRSGSTLVATGVGTIIDDDKAAVKAAFAAFAAEPVSTGVTKKK